jgi:hypothetical protein
MTAFSRSYQLLKLYFPVQTKQISTPGFFTPEIFVRSCDLHGEVRPSTRGTNRNCTHHAFLKFMSHSHYTRNKFRSPIFATIRFQTETFSTNDKSELPDFVSTHMQNVSKEILQ